ncbi:Glutamyl endopeptidase precursor [Phycisphaerae bacterium RAS1]|nr:Glutamyl endopeptidase precursor [Phycisphaerae bacterium RAS1]
MRRLQTALLSAGTIALGLAALAAAPPADDQGSGQSKVSEPTPGENQRKRPPGTIDNPEGLRRFQRPFPHQNVPPMPIPHDPDDDAPPGPPAENSVPTPRYWLVRDLITGDESFVEGTPDDLNLDELRLQLGRMARPAADSAADAIESELEFEPAEGDSMENTLSAPTIVTTETTFPYSTVVALFNSAGQCSGTLIDAKHVLTAGHCVEAGGGGAAYTNFYVVPAWEGLYDSSGNPTGSFGGANAVRAWVASGWTAGADFDDDLAILELDRPVGALTGWLGYGASSSPSFFTGNTFYGRGYPGSGGFPGDQMYTRSGPFDSTDYTFPAWFGNEVRSNSRGYFGESGSGEYTLVSGSRYVFAVFSNISTSSPWHSDCCRLTSGDFSDIESAILSATPSSADLVPLDVDGPSYGVRGSAFPSSLSVRIVNSSRVSWSGTLTYTWYLSTNDNISTGDLPIAYTTRSGISIGDNDSVVPSGSALTVPTGISAGSYFVGVIVTSSDSDSSNNDSDGWDAHPIVIY